MSSPSRLVAIAIVVVVVVGASSWCHAFVAPSSSCHAFAAPLISSQVISPSSSSSSSASSATAITFFDSSSRSRTTLFNKRRGQLGNNVSFDDDGTVRLISNKQKQRRGSNISSANKKSSNKRGSKGGVDGENEVLISPLLAQWAATDMIDSPSTSSSVAAFNSITDDDDDDAAVNYQVLDGTTSSQKVDILLEEINAMLSTNNCNVPNLVANIVSLVNLGSQSSSSKNNDRILLPTLKALLSSKSITRNNSRKQPSQQQQQQQQQQRPPSYRLAWAGSDNAICHIGTSLHKVPLARLQEIYLTLGGGGDNGKNKWELLEVIRILGPFPNVRNTLRGEVTKLMKLGDGSSSTSMGMKRGESSISSSGSSGREGVRMEIAYNSMIDGTGKEILASGESRVKYVQLDIWYASAKALVCTTVPSSENGDDADSSNNNIGNKDPLSSSTDGSRILFFVAEENLEEQLEKLRAA